MPVMPGEVPQQFIESLHNMPAINHPIEAVAVLAAGAVAIAAGRASFNKAHEQYTSDCADPEQLIQSIKEVRGEDAKPDDAGNRKRRLRPAYLSIAGLAITAASFVGQPTYNTDTLNNAANVVVVEDVTPSMWYTSDLGSLSANKPALTRDQAVLDGISASNYTGTFSAIQTADTATAVISPQRNWKEYLPLLNEAHVGQINSIQTIVPAIQQAESLLPYSGNGKNQKREGTIVIASDGTVDDTAQQIQTEAAKLKHDGVKVEVVVPGTGTGQYTLYKGGQAFQSGVEPATFQAFGASHIEQPQTARATVEDIKNAINDAGKEQHKNTWLASYVLGIGMLLTGYGAAMKRTFTRTV